MSENEAQQLEEFYTFLERTGSCITDDTLHSMKTVLKGMNDVDYNYLMNNIVIKKKDNYILTLIYR